MKQKIIEILRSHTTLHKIEVFPDPEWLVLKEDFASIADEILNTQPESECQQNLPEEIQATISAGDWLRLKETDKEVAKRLLNEFIDSRNFDNGKDYSGSQVALLFEIWLDKEK